jgi:lipoprotein-anchoring transpeptidase ErfK/SrfK
VIEEEVSLLEEIAEDPIYLKKFVKEHPENKMGWYLLGKQYESQGKNGKAKYCFAQAGNIYSAFEMTNAVELDPAETELNQEAQPIKSRTNTGHRLKRRLILIYRSVIIAIIVILLLTYIPSKFADPAHEESISISTKVMDSGLSVYYIQEDSPSKEIKEALHKMVTVIDQEKKLSIIVKAARSKDSQWVMWQNEPKPLLSALKESETGTLEVQYHDSQLCECTVVDGSSALRTVKSWKQQQEQLVVLRSAMVSYEERYGDLPEKAEQLTRNYPQNLLPGLTELMRKAYEVYTNGASVVESKNGNRAIEATSPPFSSPKSNVDLPSERPNFTINRPVIVKPNSSQKEIATYAAVPPLTDQLEILVDPNTHQLALVSGRVILRKYPVGLGGEKTPQGSFKITEKVRNPNGHDDGDFGSRGMTLSNTLYAIHGTNKPSSIGLDQSQGCIRMKREDIEELFDMTPIGTKVTIGKVKLPTELTKEKTRFHSPLLREETNPGRIYKWLN